MPASYPQAWSHTDKPWRENLGLLLDLPPMSSAQASFCLEFPDISSITQLRRTLAGVGVYLRRTGANLLFGHRAGWLELGLARNK